VLARAFHDSPGYNAILGHIPEPRREHVLRRVKWGFVQSAIRHQEAHGIWVGDDLVGATLCMAPGQYPTSLIAEAWESAGCVTAGPRAVLNFLRMRAYIARKHVTERHYYLFVIGVEPRFQGKGLGKALLARMHGDADAQGVASYLETDTTANVRLYEGVGYRVLTDENVPTLPALRFWTMRRPAAEVARPWRSG
jgi:GNAT superfamily N-acetyltransferase